jgi:hypothetical protein
MTASISGNIHGHSNPVGSLRVDERANVRHTEGSEFFTLRRRKPMLNVVDIVIDQYLRHLSSWLRAIETSAASPATCRT